MTSGRNAANFRTDSRACIQLVVPGTGGRQICCRVASVSKRLSRFMVVTASPASKMRSSFLKNDKCPGECPGVKWQSHLRTQGSGRSVSRIITRLPKFTVLEGNSRLIAEKKPGAVGSRGGYEDRPVR